MAAEIKLFAIIITLTTAVLFAGPPQEKSKSHKSYSCGHCKQNPDEIKTIAEKPKVNSLFRVVQRDKFREETGVVIYDASLPSPLLEELYKYPKLNYIYIFDTTATELSPSIGTFRNINNLRLEIKKLKSLPSEINQLKKLSAFTVKCPELSTLDAKIIELPELNRVTIDANLEEFPPIPSTIHKLDLTNNRLKKVSWYLSEKSRDNFTQDINLHNNPIEELPDNLIYYIWEKNIDIRSSYRVPKIPTQFKMSPYGAYLDPYHKNMELDSTQFTIQWYERVSGPKGHGERDTLRIQYMYHPTGLPILNEEKGRHIKHGKQFHSAVVGGYSALIEGAKGERHKREEKILYLGYLKDTLHCDTSSYRDSLIDIYKEKPRHFRKSYRHGKLNDTTCFMAEVALNKKSGKMVTYNDGTPYIVGDILVIEQANENRITLHGKDFSQKLKSEEYSLSLNEWRALPQKEKMKLVDSFIEKHR